MNDRPVNGDVHVPGVGRLEGMPGDGDTAKDTVEVLAVVHKERLLEPKIHCFALRPMGMECCNCEDDCSI